MFKKKFRTEKIPNCNFKLIFNLKKMYKDLIIKKKQKTLDNRGPNRVVIVVRAARVASPKPRGHRLAIAAKK